MRGVMGLVMSRKVDFMRSMGVAAVRHVNDGLELMRFRNLSRGFEIFTICAKDESLAHVVGSHCFNSYDRVPRHRTRLPVLVMEKEPEPRWHVGFTDSDLNKAVTEVDEEAIVGSAFDFPSVMRVSAPKMRMALAVNMPSHMVEPKSHQSPTRHPRQPAAGLASPRDAAPNDQAVGSDQ